MTPGSLRGGAQGILTSRYILPNFSERTTNGTREYNPYGKLFEERIVFLGTEIDETAANDTMAQILCLEFLGPDRDISIYINSPGGSFNALTAIYDTMQFVRPEIQTVCLGQANSVAAVILAAGTAGKRMVLPHSRVLLCQPDSPTARYARARSPIWKTMRTNWTEQGTGSKKSWASTATWTPRRSVRTSSGITS
ncbi:ATP-dependent Clp protease proteolytic subunit 2 [Streptomyces noursei ATCC 11455]|nr:ATP-dependent Clp protease proteolytic subunit 2 [Streptomyces noursei ATCC 11455]